MMRKLIPIVLIATLVSHARSHAAAPLSPVLAAMQAELSRGMARLRLKGYEAPYFIAYAVRDYQQRSVGSRFGAPIDRSVSHSRQAWAEVRVGDYQFDNTSSDRELQFDLGDADSWDPPTEAPLDDDPEALRGTLWLLTDAKYKKALGAYAKKRGKRATTISEDESLPSFSREPAARHVDPTTPFVWDEQSLQARATRASALFKQYPDLFEGSVKVSGDRVTRWFVNSEGTAVQTERTIYAVHLAATTRAKDGMLLEHEKDFYGRGLDELPDDKVLADTIAVLADGAARAARGADDRSLHRPRDPDGGGGGRLLPRDGRTPARGRAAERREGGPHLQGAGRPARAARLPERHRRSDGALGRRQEGLAQRLVHVRRRRRGRRARSRSSTTACCATT